MKTRHALVPIAVLAAGGCFFEAPHSSNPPQNNPPPVVVNNYGGGNSGSQSSGPSLPPPPPPQGMLSPAELEDLCGPIALYPDQLLANVLAASIYPSDVTQCAELINNGTNPDPDHPLATVAEPTAYSRIRSQPMIHAKSSPSVAYA